MHKILNTGLLFTTLLVNGFVNADEIKDVDLGNITTTATGFESYVKNVPASVEIVTQEELQSRPIRDLGDAVSGLPGVDVTYDKTGQGQISIRGFGDAYTLVLIDGKNQNPDSGFKANGFGTSHSFIPPVSMIERIEVLKGPASTIYGSGAIGGVINIITKKHPSKPTASITLETTQQEERKIWGSNVGVSGSVATPLIQDMLSLSINGKYFNNLVNNIKTPAGAWATHSPGAYSIKGIGQRLTFTPNKQNNFYLDAEFYDQLVEVLSTSSSAVRSLNKYTRTNAVLNHDGKYSFGQTNTYFQYNTSQRHTGATRQSDKYVLDSKVNVPFDLNDAGFLTLNAGFNYTYNYFKDYSATKGIYKQNQAALYGEVDYAINEIVSLIGGARYNYSDLFDHNISPRIYAIFNPIADFTIKAGVAAGYFTPSIQYLFPGQYVESTQSASLGNPSLNPETSWNYEISGILDLPYSQITLTGFFTQFIDRVSTLSLDNGDIGFGGIACTYLQGCTQRYNISSAIQYGGELGLKTKDFFGFIFDAGYTLTLSRIKYTGESLSSVPRQTFNAKISYKYDNFSAYLAYKAKIKTKADLLRARVDYYRDFHLLDLGLGYKLTKNLHLNFVINNLTNKNFLDFSAGNRTQFQYYQPGRNYWISLRMDV